MMKLILIFILSINLQILFSQRKDMLEYSPFSDTLEINHINKTISNSLFSFVKNRIDFVQYDDNDNCDIRAHLICFVLQKKFNVLKVGKAWLFADSKRASKKYIYDDGGSSNLSMRTKGVNWGYHVAPILIFENDTLVIDPSTQNAAVPIRKWATDLIPLGTKGYMIFKNYEYFCFPSDDEDKFIDYNVSWNSFNEEDKPTDEFADIAEKISEAYNGISEPSKVVYYKNKITKLCKE